MGQAFGVADLRQIMQIMYPDVEDGQMDGATKPIMNIR